MATKFIKIMHDDSDTAMGFASTEDLENYDFSASVEKFNEMVIDAVSAEYPGYKVEIEGGSDDTAVMSSERGRIAEALSDTVKEIVSDVFHSQEWLIEK